MSFIARTNEGKSACEWGTHKHSIIDLPQGELKSEINACFLFNEHGDLYFLVHNVAVQIILSKLKI